jgi:hypothetical protein
MQVSINLVDNQYWVTLGSKEYGAFATVLDASTVVVQFIADWSFERFGNNVYFLEARTGV